MKVTILGCGGAGGGAMLGGEDGRGIWGQCDPNEPRNIRTRASVFIRMDDGEGILVDTGPDIRAQLLANGISAFRSIFFTHAHADHIAGLDEVRGINRTIGQPITAYATPSVLEEVQTRFNYVFQPWTTAPHFFWAVVEAQPVPLHGDVVMSGYKISLFEQNHGRIPSGGLRCGDFAYSTDTVELPEASFDVLDGVDTWIVDCFQKEPHSAHAWLERVLEWKERVQPRRLILTHLGPDMDWAWMRNTLPAGVEAAYDGLSFTLPDPEKA